MEERLLSVFSTHVWLSLSALKAHFCAMINFLYIFFEFYFILFIYLFIYLFLFFSFFRFFGGPFGDPFGKSRFC